MTVVLVLVWLIGSVFVGIAADGRGRFGIAWFFLALICSPLLTAPLLALLPMRLRDATEDLSDVSGSKRRVSIAAQSGIAIAILVGAYLTSHHSSVTETSATPSDPPATIEDSCNAPDCTSGRKTAAQEESESAPIKLGPKLLVALTPHVSMGEDKRMTVTGNTNLPDGTTLIVSIYHVDGYLYAGTRYRVSKNLTVKDGRFATGPMHSYEAGEMGNSPAEITFDDPNDHLVAGTYELEIFQPYPLLQPPSIWPLIGKRGENLEGPLVRVLSDLTKYVDYKMRFHVDDSLVPKYAPIPQSRGRIISAYEGRIRAAVLANVHFAPADGVEESAYAEYEVRLIPTTGELAGEPTLVHASGLPGWDDAARRAILRTDPFPLQDDGTAPRSFHLRLRPTEAR